MWWRAARYRWQTHTKYRINRNVFRLFFPALCSNVCTKRVYIEWERCAMLPSLVHQNYIDGMIFDGFCFLFHFERTSVIGRFVSKMSVHYLTELLLVSFFILQLSTFQHLRPPLQLSHQRKRKMKSIKYLWKPNAHITTRRCRPRRKKNLNGCFLNWWNHLIAYSRMLQRNRT